MKKLKLDVQNLKEAELLTKEELKKILGGSGSGGGNEGCSATASCSDGTTATVSCSNIDSTCTAVDATGTQNGYAYCQGGPGGIIYYANCD